MDLKTKIDSIFPEEKSVPKDIMVHIPPPIHRYLIDGELREWKGPAQKEPFPSQTPSGPFPSKPWWLQRN